jgi:hypothetical protein
MKADDLQALIAALDPGTVAAFRACRSGLFVKLAGLLADEPGADMLRMRGHLRRSAAQVRRLAAYALDELLRFAADTAPGPAAQATRLLQVAMVAPGHAKALATQALTLARAADDLDLELKALRITGPADQLRSQLEIRAQGDQLEALAMQLHGQLLPAYLAGQGGFLDVLESHPQLRPECWLSERARIEGHRILRQLCACSGRTDQALHHGMATATRSGEMRDWIAVARIRHLLYDDAGADAALLRAGMCEGEAVTLLDARIAIALETGRIPACPDAIAAADPNVAARLLARIGMALAMAGHYKAARIQATKAVAQWPAGAKDLMRPLPVATLVILDMLENRPLDPDRIERLQRMAQRCHADAPGLRLGLLAFCRWALDPQRPPSDALRYELAPLESFVAAYQAGTDWADTQQEARIRERKSRASWHMFRRA